MRNFLIHSNNIQRDSFVWNMTGSMLMAFQSVIMLMILSRILGLEASGIFTIAYANAILFMTIGKYGMRNFQVSDVKKQFSFHTYQKSRMFTSCIMMLIGVIYILYSAQKNHYTSEKILIMIWMCFFKVVDALEDVYHGRYQQANRLDIAGKSLTIRLFITTVFFAISLIYLKNLLKSLILTTVVTALTFLIFTHWGNSVFKITESTKEKQSYFPLLKTCLPLFLSSFLSIYIGNAPKYAIDSILNDELQACYGFIAMPVFVIGLLNNFIFNPLVFRLSLMWNENKIKNFIKWVCIQCGIIVFITIVCIFGAYLIGIPVLSFLYNVNLAPYKKELLILLLGGGFLALSGLLNTIITIMRKQKFLIIIYGVVAAMALILSPMLVKQYAMLGASVLYLLLMILLCIMFATMLIGILVVEKKLPLRNKNCIF